MTNEATADVVETTLGVGAELEVVDDQADVDLEQIEGEVREYIEANENDATREAYFYDWKHFAEWCAERGRQTAPADPVVVAGYLKQMAAGELGQTYTASTIRRRMTTIGKMHRERGLEDPTASEQVRATWKAIRRDPDVQVAHEGKTPLMSRDVRRMVRQLDTDTAKGCRDRAMLLVGFAGGMRRSEIAGLDVGDLEFAPEGVAVHIRQSKTDQEGRGHVAYLTYADNPETCPVEALRAWLEVADIDEGAVFRNVGRWGTVRDGRVSGKTINRAVKAAADAIGRDPSDIGAHSLRAGHVTERKARGESDSAIMDQTNQSQSTLRRYDRAAKRFRHDTSGALGL